MSLTRIFFDQPSQPIVGTDTGTLNNVVISDPLPVGARHAPTPDGHTIIVVPAFTNTGAVVINYNGQGNLPLHKGAGSALVAGDIVAGVAYVIILHGSTDWRMSSTPGAGGTPIISGGASISSGPASNVPSGGPAQNVLFGTVSFDIGGYVTGGGKFTVPASQNGIYQLNAQVTLQNTGSNNEMEVAITVNGAFITAASGLTDTTAYETIGLSTTLALVAGDIVRVTIQNQGASAATINNGTNTFFGITKLISQ